MEKQLSNSMPLQHSKPLHPMSLFAAYPKPSNKRFVKHYINGMPTKLVGISDSPHRSSQRLILCTPTGSFQKITRSSSSFELSHTGVYSSQEDLRDHHRVRKAMSYEDVHGGVPNAVWDLHLSESGVSVNDSHTEDDSFAGVEDDTKSQYSYTSSSAFCEITGESEFDRLDSDSVPGSMGCYDKALEIVQECAEIENSRYVTDGCNSSKDSDADSNDAYTSSKNASQNGSFSHSTPRKKDSSSLSFFPADEEQFLSRQDFSNLPLQKSKCTNKTQINPSHCLEQASVTKIRDNFFSSVQNLSQVDNVESNESIKTWISTGHLQKHVNNMPSSSGLPNLQHNKDPCTRELHHQYITESAISVRERIRVLENNYKLETNDLQFSKYRFQTAATESVGKGINDYLSCQSAKLFGSRVQKHGTVNKDKSYAQVLGMNCEGNHEGKKEENKSETFSSNLISGVPSTVPNQLWLESSSDTFNRNAGFSAMNKTDLKSNLLKIENGNFAQMHFGLSPEKPSVPSVIIQKYSGLTPYLDFQNTNTNEKSELSYTKDETSSKINTVICHSACNNLTCSRDGGCTISTPVNHTLNTFDAKDPSVYLQSSNGQQLERVNMTRKTALCDMHYENSLLNSLQEQSQCVQSDSGVCSDIFLKGSTSPLDEYICEDKVDSEATGSLIAMDPVNQNGVNKTSEVNSHLDFDKREEYTKLQAGSHATFRSEIKDCTKLQIYTEPSVIDVPPNQTKDIFEVPSQQKLTGKILQKEISYQPESKIHPQRDAFSPATKWESNTSELVTSTDCSKENITILSSFSKTTTGPNVEDDVLNSFSDFVGGLHSELTDHHSSMNIFSNKPLQVVINQENFPQADDETKAVDEADDSLNLKLNVHSSTRASQTFIAPCIQGWNEVNQHHSSFSSQIDERDKLLAITANFESDTSSNYKHVVNSCSPKLSTNEYPINTSVIEKTELPTYFSRILTPKHSATEHFEWIEEYIEMFSKLLSDFEAVIKNQNDLYLAFTNEEREKCQNHTCPVLDDGLSVLRFKRFLKQKGSRRFLQTLDNLEGVSSQLEADEISSCSNFGSMLTTPFPLDLPYKHEGLHTLPDAFSDSAYSTLSNTSQQLTNVDYSISSNCDNAFNVSVDNDTDFDKITTFPDKFHQLYIDEALLLSMQVAHIPYQSPEEK